MKATSNIIELRPYLQTAGSAIPYRPRSRRAVKRAHRAAIRCWFSAAMDMLCYLTLLVCLIIGAIILVTLV